MSRRTPDLAVRVTITVAEDGNLANGTTYSSEGAPFMAGPRELGEVIYNTIATHLGEPTISKLTLKRVPE